MAISVDFGTYNLVTCRRDKKNNFEYKKEVNAFIEIPLEDRFIFEMMRSAGVPLIERETVAYALGEAAVKMAYAMSDKELRRPMKKGCVNPKEKDAFQIMSIMIHSLINTINYDKELLYYTVPANAINEETDADYHQKLCDKILKKFKDGDKILDPHPINEALALIYAEAADKNYTAVSCSFGGGMINVCFAIFGVPVFKFAIANSGDHIDQMAAKATGESPAFINQEKTKIDLEKEPTSIIERAIQTQYQIMIEKTVIEIKRGIEQSGKKARTDKPIDIIVAGGTASPNGFDKLFEQILKESKISIDIGKVIRPPEPLYSVAKGALIAAENASKTRI